MPALLLFPCCPLSLPHPPPAKLLELCLIDLRTLRCTLQGWGPMPKLPSCSLIPSLPSPQVDAKEPRLVSFLPASFAGEVSVLAALRGVTPRGVPLVLMGVPLLASSSSPRVKLRRLHVNTMLRDSAHAPFSLLPSIKMRVEHTATLLTSWRDFFVNTTEV